MILLSLGTTLMHILIGNIIPFLFVLGIVVFVHEFGHFIVGRWCGVGVWTFSLGFGPELFGFNDRKGTRWRIAAVPLGGYVKFYGDQNAAGLPDEAALAKMSPEDAAQEPAGPTGVGARFDRRGRAGGEFHPRDLDFLGDGLFLRQADAHARASSVSSPRAPRQAAGFLPGDLMLKVDGQRDSGLLRAAAGRQHPSGQDLTFVVERAGAGLTLVATPVLTDDEDALRPPEHGPPRRRPSTDPSDLHYTYPSLPRRGRQRALGNLRLRREDLGPMWPACSLGRESASQLSGPLGIGQAVGVVASWGLVPLFNFMAWMSVSVGLINLFPIPLLDGGHFCSSRSKARADAP